MCSNFVTKECNKKQYYIILYLFDNKNKLCGTFLGFIKPSLGKTFF